MVEKNSYFDSPVPSKDYKRLFRDGYGGNLKNPSEINGI